MESRFDSFESRLQAAFNPSNSRLKAGLKTKFINLEELLTFLQTQNM